MKKSEEIIYNIGLTTICLGLFAIIIVIFELLGFIQFYIGSGLLILSPLDTWLIIILLIFFPAFYIIIIVIQKLRGLT